MRDVKLAAGDELALQVPADTELFCASGAVVVAMVAAAYPWPGRRLGPGQALRCPEGGLLTLRAMEPCRCRLSEAPSPTPAAAPPPRTPSSLRAWRRRLSWGR